MAVSALELAAVRSEFGRRGVFSVAVAGTFHRHLAAVRAIDRLLPALLGTQALGAVALAAVGPFAPAGQWILFIVLVATVAVRWRRHAGGDGAEQMAVLILLAAALAVLPVSSPTRVTMAVVFISGQLVLSYLAAGVAKLVSPMWRSGEALPAIVATYGHGHPWAAMVLRRWPGLARLAGWSVIAFECTFPLLFLGPDWLALTALAVGLTFHIGCAVVMGLNSFLWSFPATYPCVLAVAAHLSLA